MKILIAPNSFKECDNSVNISKLILNKLSNSLNIKKLDYLLYPISDGGDGFLEVTNFYFDTDIYTVEIVAPDGIDRINVEYGIKKDHKTAYIESAKVIGLNILPESKRAPLKLNTQGFGQLIKHIHKIHPEVEEIITGIGGTATNDLGIGALCELGLKLLDAEGVQINPFPDELVNLNFISSETLNLPVKIKFVADVSNPLLGENGATRIYGPQKGIRNEQFEIFDNLFNKVIELAPYNGKVTNLSGAGGGIIAGFQLFSEVDVISSMEFMELCFSGKDVIKPDFVITGEGMLDDQTFMNKGIKNLLDKFPDSKFYIITGLNRSRFNSERVHIVELTKYFSSISQSIQQFEQGIDLACKEISKDILFKLKDA